MKNVLKNYYIIFLLLITTQFGFGQIGFQENQIPVFHNSASLNNIDIDNDGDMDFLVAVENEIYLYENLGTDANFSPPQLIISIPLTNQNNTLEIESIYDIDSDGDEDVFVSFYDNINGTGDLYWYENNGGNSFSEKQIIDIVNSPLLENFFIQFFDYDNDQDSDLLLVRFSNSTPFNGEFLLYDNLDGLGTFSNAQNINTNLNPLFVYNADVDSDNDVDLICHTNTGDNFWLENGNGIFLNENFISTSNPPKIALPTDVDNDSDIDLVYISTLDLLNPTQNSGIIEWHENTDGLGNFVFKQELLNNPNGFYNLDIEDMDNDGDVDIVAISPNDILFFENTDGIGNFGNEQIVSSMNQNGNSITLFDIDLDGDKDIIIGSIINNQIIWYENLKLGNEINGNVKLNESGTACDSNSSNISNLLISSDNGVNSFSSYSNFDGTYQIPVNAGNFTTKIQNLPTYFTSNPAQATTNFIDLGNTDTVDFCLVSTTIASDLNITIIPPTDEPRPGFDTSYQIIYSNIGTTQLNGDITFTYDSSKIQFLSSSETVASQTANSLTFNYANLNPFETRTIDLNFNVFPPPITNIDEILVSTATITPTSGDETQNDNTFTLEQTVIGSYDPNDIQILEGDQVHIDDADEYLHFLIRFQNTGTASAINVRVEHILDNKLDWTTMQLQSLSHDGRVEITDGSDVQFIFNNINLPDQTTDEEGSIGYIAFKIKPKDNVVLGDIISGVADIYFDFNPPIITNTATTEFVDNLSDESFSLTEISIYPNPTDGLLSIQSNSVIDRVEVFDMLGRQLLNQHFDQTHADLDLSTFQNGVYFLRIESNGRTETRKIIKN